MGITEAILKEVRDQGTEKGMEKGMEKGIEKGIKTGIKKGDLNRSIIAIRNLYIRGVQPTEIAEIMGMELSKVNTLLEEIKKGQAPE